MSDLLVSSAISQAAAIAAGDLSAVELLTQTFARVDALNPELNAVIWQDREAAMA